VSYTNSLSKSGDIFENFQKKSFVEVALGFLFGQSVGEISPKRKHWSELSSYIDYYINSLLCVTFSPFITFWETLFIISFPIKSWHMPHVGGRPQT
jgi:hypothetical protein